MFDAAVEIKTPNKHVEAAIPVVLGRGFNSLRLHWFQWNPNPQVVQPAQLAGFLLSHLQYLTQLRGRYPSVTFLPGNP